MPTTGLTLGAWLMTSLNDTITGIVNSLMNIWPTLIFAGLGVWWALFVIKKIPGFFKRLVK